MSKEAVESVIGKALLETDFRHALMADPDHALAGFNLTKAEKASLMSMDSETWEYIATILDRREGKRRLAVG